MRTAILVSGMHRSGTSALTRVISLLGAALPEQLIEGRSGDNEPGFWEGRQVVDLNQKVLTAADTWWGGWQRVDDKLLTRSRLVQRARRVLRNQYGDAELVVIKDPRISRLLPLWTRALAKEGFRCVHVVALRHPAAVAASLARRNELSAKASALSWLAHSLDAEAFTRDERRVFVSFENLVRDWRTEMRRTSDALDIGWPRGLEEVADQVASFIQPDLVHEVPVSRPRGPVGAVMPVYDVLRGRSEDGGVIPGDSETLEYWRDVLAPVRATGSATARIARRRNETLSDLRATKKKTAAMVPVQAWGPIEHEAHNVEAAAAWRWLARERQLRLEEPRRPGVAQDVMSRLRITAVGKRLGEQFTRRRDATDAPVTTDQFRPTDRPVPTETTPVVPVEVPVENTNLGPSMDALVSRAKGMMRPRGEDLDYDEIRDHFDVTHFLLQTPALMENLRVDPITYYMRRGSDGRQSPDINFSTGAYLRRYPELEGSINPYLHWLRRGRAAGEIADPAPSVDAMAHVLGLETNDLVSQVTAIRTDLQERLRRGTLGAMFARAAEVEPLIAAAWSETTRPNILPVSTRTAVEEVTTIHACQEAAGFRRARLIIVINRPRWGGGRRIEGHIAHALAVRIDPTDIVVIHTDKPGVTPPGRYPTGVREIDFAGIAEGMDPLSAQQALVALIRSFEADAVLNINSRLLHHAMTPFGRALAATERLFPIFFCNEQGAQGNWDGWSLRQFYRTFDVVEAVLTDSEYLRQQLVDAYQLSDGEVRRLHVLKAPVDPGLQLVTAPPISPERRPQVFWAGRWDRQKRMDIVLEVARRMPDVDFRLWGEAVLQGAVVGDVPDNVKLEGRYAHISQVDLSAADVWLYTSAWDGVPSLLLEIGMTGVPIVGSLVGGTREVLDKDVSWPVFDVESPEAYEKAIRDVLADPVDARRRSSDLRDRLLRERAQEAFVDQVSDLLLLDSDAGQERDR